MTRSDEISMARTVARSAEALVVAVLLLAIGVICVEVLSDRHDTAVDVVRVSDVGEP